MSKYRSGQARLSLSAPRAASEGVRETRWQSSADRLQQASCGDATLHGYDRARFAEAALRGVQGNTASDVRRVMRAGLVDGDGVDQ